MAEAKKPAFIKVDQLRPATGGHALVVKVLDSKMIAARGGRSDGQQYRQSRFAECLVGDETGIIVFAARNEQGWMLLFFFFVAIIVWMLLSITLL